MYTHRYSVLLTTAALTALLAHSAAAQDGTLNLQSGDVVTVTAAGTISNQVGGSSTTSTYDAGPNLFAVDAEAGSTFNLAGGSITGEDGDSAIYGNGSTITISSGFVTSTGSGTNGLFATSGTKATVTGGTFIASGVRAGETPHPLATPGPAISAVDLYASQSTVIVTGGLFTASDTGTAGFYATNGGVISLFGTGFIANGRAVTGPITTGSGTLSGTLLNGNAFTNLPYTVLGGSIQFTPAPAAAPEPSAWVVFAIGLAAMSGLGGWNARRRRAGSV